MHFGARDDVDGGQAQLFLQPVFVDARRELRVNLLVEIGNVARLGDDLEVALGGFEPGPETFGGGRS
jgi:hypothetical protein